MVALTEFRDEVETQVFTGNTDTMRMLEVSCCSDVATEQRHRKDARKHTPKPPYGH